MTIFSRIAVALGAIVLLIAPSRIEAQTWDCQDCGQLTRRCLNSGSSGAVICVEEGSGCVMFGSCNVTSASELSSEGFRIRRDVASVESKGIFVSGAVPFGSMLGLNTLQMQTDCGGFLQVAQYSEVEARLVRRNTSTITI